jgi:hypothetical protein
VGEVELSRELIRAVSADLAETLTIAGISFALGAIAGAVGLSYVWLCKREPK